MNPGPFERFVPHLAAGDLPVLDTDWSAFSLETVRGSEDPLFDEAYERLWREFGASGEMERREVLDDRLRWNPLHPLGGWTFLYELLVVRRDAEIVAIRDHTAIASPAFRRGDAAAGIVVHLSHVLVDEALRGSGLASWMRVMPLDTARRCAEAADADADADSDPVITLVAEMEHDDGGAAATRRLRSYARGGFLLVDPARSGYRQPDFRGAAEIESSLLRPVPMSLVVRRVGRESETAMPRAELREIVRALYAMFAVHVRADHMPALPEATGAPGEMLALLDPAATSREAR